MTFLAEILLAALICIVFPPASPFIIGFFVLLFIIGFIRG